MVSMVAASVHPISPKHLVRARFSYALWGLLLCVTLAHLLALQWVGGAAPLALQTMPEPVFARVLLPHTPPEPQVPVSTERPAPPAKPAPRATVSAASPAPAPATAPTTDPTAEPTPEPLAEPDAQALATPGTEPAADLANAPPPPPATAQKSPPVDPWPPSTRLTYALIGNFRGDIFGNAKMQWLRQDDRYQVQMDIRLAVFFQLKLTSQGQVTGAGLLPSRYEEVSPRRRSQVSIEGQQVRLSDGQTLPAPEGVQDTASQFMELAHRFSTGRDPLKVGSEVALWLARPNGVELRTFDIVTEEMLDTPKLGPLKTFRLKPRPLANQRGNIVVELWFAPSLQYLPVRVLVTQGDGNFVDLMVETVEQTTPDTAPNDSVQPKL